MGSPYSLDLRKRVIEMIDNGATQAEVAKIYKISRRVITNWLKLRSQTNSLDSKKGYQKGHSHKIKDWDEFKKFVETNKNCTGKEMAEKWKILKDIKMSVHVIYEGLAKIGYSFKKKLLVMKKAI